MKIVSALLALACCGMTVSLAFGQALSGMADNAAETVLALATSPPLAGFDLPEALALLGGFVVFSSGTRRSQDW